MIFPLCLALVGAMSGCGGGAADGHVTERVNVSGTVKFDGQPLPAGTVTFMNHQTGNMAICEIDDGEYENESGEGPNPGTNTVQIMGKESADGNPMWARPWTKEINVGDSDFEQDFEIQSSEVEPFDPSSVRIDE